MWDSFNFILLRNITWKVHNETSSRLGQICFNEIFTNQCLTAPSASCLASYTFPDAFSSCASIRLHDLQIWMCRRHTCELIVRFSNSNRVMMISMMIIMMIIYPKVLSPVCVFTCEVRETFCPKVLLQNSHLKCFQEKLIQITFKSNIKTSYLNGLIPWCLILSCRSKDV